MAEKMKVKLVFDAPKGCLDCPLCQVYYKYAGDRGEYWCRATANQIPAFNNLNIKNTRMANCPLQFERIAK